MPPPPSTNTSRQSTPSVPTNESAPYISTLRPLDGSVPDLASTLSVYTAEDEANDANVSFLRTPLEPAEPAVPALNLRIDPAFILPGATADMASGEGGDYYARVLTELEDEADTLRHQLRSLTRRTQELSTTQSPERSPRRDSTNRTAARNGVDPATWEEEGRLRRERLQRVLARLNSIDDPAYSDRVPSHNSLYDWSPATEPAASTTASADTELRDHIRELQQQQPNTHPEILRVRAQMQLDAERDLRNNAARMSGTTSIASSRPRDGQPRASSSAVLQAIRRLPRDRDTSAQNAETSEDQPTLGASRTDAGASPRANAYRRQAEAYRQLNQHRREASSTRSPPSYAQRCPASAFQNVTWFQQAIIYLANLRESNSLDESLRFATEAGFAVKAFLTDGNKAGREEDFVLDLWGLPPPEQTSLLAPGTIFKGIQKARETERLSMVELARRYAQPPSESRDTPARFRGPRSSSTRVVAGSETRSTSRWANPAPSGQWNLPTNDNVVRDASAPEALAPLISASRLNSLPPLESLYPSQEWLRTTEEVTHPLSPHQYANQVREQRQRRDYYTSLVARANEEQVNRPSAATAESITSSNERLRQITRDMAEEERRISAEQRAQLASMRDSVQQLESRLRNADDTSARLSRLAAEAEAWGRNESRSSAPTSTTSVGNEWPVHVTIHSVDYDTMTLAAEMVAFDVPAASSASSRRRTQAPSPAPLTATRKSITTYLEGEILDFRTTTFLTENFTASPSIDATYWRKLEPFRDMPDEEVAAKLMSRDFLAALSREYILMRWKERCFVKGMPKYRNKTFVGGEVITETSIMDIDEATEIQDDDGDVPDETTCGLTISGFYYVCLRRRDGNVEGFYYDAYSSPYQHLTLQREGRSGGVAWEFQ